MSEKFPAHHNQEENNFEWVKPLDGQPDKLLRILPLDAETPDQLKESLEVLERGEDLFRNLSDRYGIHIPHMETEVRKDDDGLTKAFTVVDRIEGLDVADAEKLPRESAREFDIFYAALVRHYGDTFRKGGDFWFDFRSDQLMYGHAPGDKKNFVWLTDVDPEYQTYDKFKKDQGKRLLKLIGRTYECTVEAENKLPAGIHLEKTRQALRDLLREIPEGEPGYDSFIRNLKPALEQRPLAA